MHDDPDRRAAEELARTVSDALSRSLRDHPLPDVVPEAHPADRRWASIIGPAYAATNLSYLLRLTATEIDTAANDLRLLRLTTSTGAPAFPAFQVVGRAVVPRLRDVLLVLRRGMDDPWTWAAWMTARDPYGPASELAISNIDRLRAGDVERVIRDATRTAAAWST